MSAPNFSIPCRIWEGSIDNSGYGKKFFRGKTYKIHRLEWEKYNGPVPSGLEVCHTCDTPPCFEITHLFLGTHQENMLDMIAKGRAGFQKKTHCAKGHEYTAETTSLNSNGSRTCTLCRAEIVRKWQKRNREHLQAYNRRYHAANRGRINARKSITDKKRRDLIKVGE